MLDPRIFLWMGVAQVFLTKASASMMRTHWAEETTEAGKEKPSKGGKEDSDDREGREEMVDEMVERVRRNPGSDKQEQGPLGCIINPCMPNPLFLALFAKQQILLQGH